ncbi:septal ring lytic transglycosylase RlpA family protein [Candidatus Babeliales bacterium]|nr:septal ring lytic transglycosylase RlpA family protein [Candidatus Babeliales bacterium]
MQKSFRAPRINLVFKWPLIPLLALCLALILLISCATKPPSDTEPAPRYQTTTPQQKLEPGFYQQGIASWYGHPFHGCATASGEIYDMHALTAAHKELPLGSRVLVTNLENNRQIEVLINDRGPFIKSRIIDLSLAGARRLAMENNGTAMVRLDITELPKSISDSLENPFAIQFGAFKNHAQAVSLKKKLGQANSKVFIEKISRSDGLLYRVRLGWFPSKAVARQEARRLGHGGKITKVS